jgi:hypothetical protein
VREVFAVTRKVSDSEAARQCSYVSRLYNLEGAPTLELNRCLAIADHVPFVQIRK